MIVQVAHDGSFTLAGDRRPADPAHTLDVTSPIDGSVVGRIHEFTPEEIDELFRAARTAQPSWAETPLDRRADILHRAASGLERHTDELTDLLVWEIAKARRDAREEVVRSADLLRYTAEEAKRVIGQAQFSDAFPGQRRNKLSVSYRVPLGCILAIPPFNYPINLAISKIAPALIAGNSVILKPPTQGALAGTRLGEILAEAGVPAGVLCVVTGRGSHVGDRLVEHPAVDMITFTGSSETGQALARRAGMVPLLLELGGKDAAIVLPDADLSTAADDIVSGAFAYSGQRCTAVKRVLVVGKVADALIDEMCKRIARLSVGDPRQDCAITPVVDKGSAERYEQLIRDAVAQGAEVICGGTREGTLCAPALVDRVTPAMDLAWVEPFAPVLPVLRMRSAAEAVDVANRSEYGLQSAVFSRDVDAAMQICLRLDVGTVQINGRTARGPDHFPFVGTKSSGMGAQGVRQSIEAMTRLKSMVFNLRDPNLEKIT